LSKNSEQQVTKGQRLPSLAERLVLQPYAAMLRPAFWQAFSQRRQDSPQIRQCSCMPVPSRDVLEIAVAVSGAMTVSRQAARSIMLLAGG
jgi:hypothetical protein